jgi:hypothetical protein
MREPTMAQEEEKKSFTVKDRRRFDASGNPREGEEDREPDKVRPPARDQASPNPKRPPEAPARGPADRTPPARPEQKQPVPESEYDRGAGPVGFAEFVLSIATNAVIHLGGESKDGRLPPRLNLPLAAQHIDIISMLAEKTRGNLTREEAELIDSLLYDLRMKYVQVAQQQGHGR